MVDTVRTIPEIQALLPDNNTKDISAQDLRDAVVSLDDTGWARYFDTQYTVGSPFLLASATDTLLPNNAGTVLNTQIPRDVTTFYSGGKIRFENGDGIAIRIDMKAKPTSAAAQALEFWLDIGDGGGPVPILDDLKLFPKGNGVERRMNVPIIGYAAATWASNGAVVHVRSDGPVSIYDISYTITRTHRGSRR